MEELGPYPPEESLAHREVQILRYLEEGLTNREIALKLALSPETIKWYNKQAYQKLGVRNRTEAVTRARELGLLDENSDEKEARPTPASSTLPLTLSSFVGRSTEIADLTELLSNARLVTLTGSGGTGKTRLALKAAETVVQNYADGVTFVSLAEFSDYRLVPRAVARRLGVTEGPGQPVVRSLQLSLANKQLLLILDNFEHVLNAAQVVIDLLAAAPQLTILITSREPLHLNGEHEYQLSPFPVPDLNTPMSFSETAEFDSVNLFKQRTQMVNATFQLTPKNIPEVAELCVRLDGLPLAIELAAARTKVLDLRQLLRRLETRLPILASGPRDLPSRQQTLRSTIDWSYDLLDDGEKRLFAQLAVFRGGSSLEAIEAVCGPGLDMDTISAIESLVNKNLIYQEEGPNGGFRFFMLETIHEYAGERLMQNDEESLVRDRHLNYFKDLVAEMDDGYRGHGQLLLLARTETEMTNLRAAFEWAIENGNIEAAARLVVPLDYFFYYTDRPVEGYQWYQRLLTKVDLVQPDSRPRLLYAAGRLAWVNGDVAQSKRYRIEALELSRQTGDRSTEGWALIHLAISYIDALDDYAAAIDMCNEGLAILRELNDRPGVAQGLNILGELYRAQGEYVSANEVYLEALAICQETGEIIRENILYHNLGFVAYQAGKYREALEYTKTAMLNQKATGFIQMALSCMGSLSGPLARLGEQERAARILGATVALMAEIGTSFQPSDQHEIDKFESYVRSTMEENKYKRLFVEGQGLTLDEAIAYALGE